MGRAPGGGWRCAGCPPGISSRILLTTSVGHLALGLPSPSRRSFTVMSWVRCRLRSRVDVQQRRGLMLTPPTLVTMGASFLGRRTLAPPRPRGVDRVCGTANDAPHRWGLAGSHPCGGCVGGVCASPDGQRLQIGPPGSREPRMGLRRRGLRGCPQRRLSSRDHRRDALLRPRRARGQAVHQLRGHRPPGVRAGAAGQRPEPTDLDGRARQLRPDRSCPHRAALPVPRPVPRAAAPD